MIKNALQKIDQQLSTLDQQKVKRFKVGGKIAFGVARIAGGIVTATGHGLLGGYLKSHHMTQAAMRLGSTSVKSGVETVKAGLEEWKQLK